VDGGFITLNLEGSLAKSPRPPTHMESSDIGSPSNAPQHNPKRYSTTSARSKIKADTHPNLLTARFTSDGYDQMCERVSPASNHSRPHEDLWSRPPFPTPMLGNGGAAQWPRRAIAGATQIDARPCPFFNPRHATLCGRHRENVNKVLTTNRARRSFDHRAKRHRSALSL
jgi:hypothetical protein